MITIKLPYPSSALLPNRSNGKHWGETSKIKKQAVEVAFYLTKEAFKDTLLINENIALTLTFVQINKRSLRDLDGNLSACKPYIDGMAQALKINDRQFEPVTLKRAYGPEPHLLVEIGE